METQRKYMRRSGAVIGWTPKEDDNEAGVYLRALGGVDARISQSLDTWIHQEQLKTRPQLTATPAASTVPVEVPREFRLSRRMRQKYSEAAENEKTAAARALMPSSTSGMLQFLADAAQMTVTVTVPTPSFKPSPGAAAVGNAFRVQHDKIREGKSRVSQSTPTPHTPS
jgi:hypothetical protein